MEDRDMNTNKHHEGWELRESGPAGADHAVLLLAGALVTAAYYDDVLAEPKLTEASVRFVAATLPGFGGTQPPRRPQHGQLREARGQSRRRLRLRRCGRPQP